MWASEVWATIMDLGSWLRSLGLERYEVAFRENAIAADVLRELTDQDLEKIGVLTRRPPQTVASNRRDR